MSGKVKVPAPAGCLRVEWNPEKKPVYVFPCSSCSGIVRYLKWKLNRGVSFKCRVCTSRSKPPPVQIKRPYEATYRLLIWSANRRKVNINLTYDEFLSYTQNPYCHYCSNQVQWSKVSSSLRKWSSATNLDRKDNSIGYSYDNCVVCCIACNKTKGDRFSYDEFMLMSPALKEIRRIRNGT